MSAYALSAIVVWTALGAGLGALPLARPALLLAAVYAAGYGLTEVAGRRWLPVPGTRWQVPQTMVVGTPARRRLLVWSTILGPGFLTRNPYAGFGLLPAVVAAAGGMRPAIVLAAAIGLAHGTGRALALLRDSRPGAALDPMRLVLVSMYWRTFDGLALLIIAGAAAVACARQFW
ncbi:MAG TPA: hypothetical protein VGG35_10975 [Streptosporangiaceae bacterium]